MSAARKAFCERIATIREAVDAFNLRDMPLHSSNATHNASVRVIRNGLVIQCFNTFEDFLKARMSEVLTSLSARLRSIQHLPEKLRDAATVGVISAIQFQLKLQDASSKARFVQDCAGKIFSTTLGSIQLPEIMFFHSASNISHEQYKEALSAFGIQSTWDQVRNLCSRIGISGMPPQEVFRSFATRRHQAAHEAGTTISELDLLQSIIDATGLALCFDVLLTNAAHIVPSHSSISATTPRALVDQASIPIRFIKSDGGRFIEIKEGSTRAFRINRDLTKITLDALNRSRAESGLLVKCDSVGIPIEWDLPS
ncbi:MAG: HEPN domain-containing protein [Verrucomicrobiaceae bacterium]